MGSLIGGAVSALGGLLGGGGSGGGMDASSLSSAQSQMQQSLQFQMEMNAMTEKYSTLSNAQKAMHDSVMEMLKNASA
jgi:hypothetical protein